MCHLHCRMPSRAHSSTPDHMEHPFLQPLTSPHDAAMCRTVRLINTPPHPAQHYRSPIHQLAGMVQAWEGQKVTLLTLSLWLSCTIFYMRRAQNVTRRATTQHHNNHQKHRSHGGWTAAPPATHVWWIHTIECMEGVGQGIGCLIIVVKHTLK